MCPEAAPAAADGSASEQAAPTRAAEVAELVEALELETVTELLVTTWLDTTAEEEEEDVEVVNPEEESLPPSTGKKSATSLDGLLLLTEFKFNEIMEVCPN